MAGERILIIEDEPDIVELIKARVESVGYRTIAAYDGLEGLKKAKEEMPDVILLDILMPKMDGISTLKKIRKIDKKIPVIMFTAYPELKAIKGTEKLGVSAFIPKLSACTDAEVNLKSAISMIEKKISKK